MSKVTSNNEFNNESTIRTGLATSLVISLVSGCIFGLGLLLSGMTNPAKIIGFLDITGMWDISLALVMGGALMVSFLGFAIAQKRVKNNQLSYAGESIDLPNKTEITPKLIIGSILFGIGWGIAGLCPGPALVMLGTGAWQVIVFIIAMLAGMGLYQLTD